MKRNHETCADCSEFPCEKFDKWSYADSFVTHQKCLPAIKKIKKEGIKEFLKEQEERKRLLKIMLEKYNSGRCTSLYCLASTLMRVESLEKALKQIEGVKENTAESFKKLIQDLAEKEKITLKLRNR